MGWSVTEGPRVGPPADTCRVTGQVGSGQWWQIWPCFKPLCEHEGSHYSPRYARGDRKHGRCFSSLLWFKKKFGLAKEISITVKYLSRNVPEYDSVLKGRVGCESWNLWLLWKHTTVWDYSLVVGNCCIITWSMEMFEHIDNEVERKRYKTTYQSWNERWPVSAVVRRHQRYCGQSDDLRLIKAKQSLPAAFTENDHIIRTWTRHTEELLLLLLWLFYWFKSWRSPRSSLQGQVLTCISPSRRNEFDNCHTCCVSHGLVQAFNSFSTHTHHISTGAACKCS